MTPQEREDIWYAAYGESQDHPDWRSLPRLENLGKFQRDCQYDGLLDGHNQDWYITVTDELDRSDIAPRAYEMVYLVYKLDPTLRKILEEGESIDCVMEARWYSSTILPAGYLLEGDKDG